MPRRKLNFSIYFAVICIFFILPFFVNAAKTNLYVKEIFEKIIDYGYFSSFDLDNFNKPHIFYVRKPGNFIEYSYLSRNKWSRFFEPVVLNGSLPKIKVKGDRPQAVYLKYNYNGHPCALQHMGLSKDKKVWNKETLNYFQFDQECPKSIDFALDSKNHPHTAYINRKNNTLFYVKKSGKFWKLEKIAKTHRDSPLVLSIDKKMNLHFVYATKNAIKYLFYGKNKKIKTKTIYKQDKNFSEMPKIVMAVDENFQPHFAYIIRKDNVIAYSNYLEYAILKNRRKINRLKIEHKLVGFYYGAISNLPLSIFLKDKFIYILYNLDPQTNSSLYLPTASSKIVRISYPGFHLKTKYINFLNLGLFQTQFDKNGALHIVASGPSDDNKSLVVYKKVKF